MFKYIIVLAVAIACVLAAEQAPKDQDTASQLYYNNYGYGAGLHYPSVYSAGLGNYGYAGHHYGAYAYPRAGFAYYG